MRPNFEIGIDRAPRHVVELVEGYGGKGHNLQTSALIIEGHLKTTVEGLYSHEYSPLIALLESNVATNYVHHLSAQKSFLMSILFVFDYHSMMCSRANDKHCQRSHAHFLAKYSDPPRTPKFKDERSRTKQDTTLQVANHLHLSLMWPM